MNILLLTNRSLVSINVVVLPQDPSIIITPVIIIRFQLNLEFEEETKM